MTEVRLPAGLVEGRRTPRFDTSTLPGPLADVHRTTVWGELVVEAGTVRYVDLDGPGRDVRLEGPDSLVIPPDVAHQIEPATDAVLWIQFFRGADDPLVPGDAPPLDSRLRHGPWEHRGRDLDDPDEIFEMVTRQYVDVVQDDLLAPYFTFGPGFIDWQAHILQVTDYWCHVLLFTQGYEIDTIDHHHRIHREHAFTPELFDRWLDVFVETVESGWTGPTADIAVKRATGMAWAMAQRLLGHGAWRPRAHRRSPGGDT